MEAVQTVPGTLLPSFWTVLSVEVLVEAVQVEPGALWDSVVVEVLVEALLGSLLDSVVFRSASGGSTGSTLLDSVVGRNASGSSTGSIRGLVGQCCLSKCYRRQYR